MEESVASKLIKELDEAMPVDAGFDASDIPSDVLSLLEDIAKEYLDINTLKTQSSGSLDFHDCSVWSLTEALYMAYEHGRAAMEKELAGEE